MSSNPIQTMRRRVAVIAVVCLGFGLTPAAASADTGAADPAPAADPATVPAETFLVRLKVADRPARAVETGTVRPKTLLAEASVALDKHDLVTVIRRGRAVTDAEKRQLRAGDVVKVVRIDFRVRVDRQRIARAVKTRKVTRLAPGERRVVAPGRPGVRKVVKTRTFRNGRLADTDTTRTVLRAPRARRVLVGAQTQSVPGTSHLNWRALANCESSGNPRAVNPAGYYGLYQFNVATWRSVGGNGMPHQASAAQQTFRAKLLYKSRGRSPWPHCGRLL